MDGQWKNHMDHRRSQDKRVGQKMRPDEPVSFNITTIACLNNLTMPQITGYSVYNYFRSDIIVRFYTFIIICITL